jgi:hypothetical protein
MIKWIGKIFDWLFPVSERDRRIMKQIQDVEKTHDVEIWTSSKGYLCGSIKPKREYVRECWNKICDADRRIEAERNEKF